jgi:hypothetical protein
MGITDVFKPKPENLSYEEKLQKNEELEVDLSITQKQVLLKRLREQGLGKSDFGNSWARIIKWLKEH